MDALSIGLHVARMLKAPVVVNFFLELKVFSFGFTINIFLTHCYLVGRSEKLFFVVSNSFRTCLV